MTLGIGLLGCGVVGGGLAELLRQRGLGLGLDLVRVAVRDRDRPRPDVDPAVPIGSIDDVLDDPRVQVVVEVIGGIEPPLSAIRRALETGRHVVTANKAVVAAHGDDLRALAARRGVAFRYEASVAGCLPIVEILENDLVFDRVDRLFGILNGTCNYILTRLRDGLTYPDALAEAQRSGFAEADPTLDVSGADTAQKLAILAGLLTRGSCPVDRIATFGIERIGREDDLAAEELGYRLKLLALFRRGAENHVRVAPTLVPKDSALGLTINEYNAVEVECAHIGWQLYLGKGAGRMPTASAVLHDLTRVAAGSRPHPIRPVLPLEIAPAGAWLARWLIRVPPKSPLSVASLGAMLAPTGVDVLELRRSRHDSVGTLILTDRAEAGAIDRVKEALRGSQPVVFAIEDDA